MTTTFSQTVFSPWLTPVRLASTSNIAGTYYNGPSNNGVGATFTVAASSLTIDSVAVEVGDRVLLQTQTATYTQGIYVVQSIGSTVVLQRADDQQCLEQLKTGQYVAVGAGSVAAGNFYTVIEPLPQAIGVDAITYAATPSSGGAVTFLGGPSTANSLAVFANTAGDIKEASAATTLGQSLSITGSLTASTSITATGGDIQSGSSGNAGNFISYPATAGNGTFIFEALNAGGAFNTTVRNSVMGQSSVISIPDPGAATATFLLSASAAGQSMAGGLTLSTGNFVVTAGAITASGNITSGASGDAGTLISFPATAANGSLIVAAANAGGAFNTTISNGTMGQSTVYTIPDVAAATGQFLVKTAAFVNGNLVQASGTAGVCVDSGVATSALQLKAQVVAATTADIGGGGAGPISVAVAGLTAASVVVATIESSSNTVAVAKCTATATGFDITFTGDPGAACLVNYVAYTAAQ